MSETNDGGPAWPITETRMNTFGIEYTDTHPGMSLRDYFAGQALAGICAAGGNPEYNIVAEHSYLIADAMLKAREVKP